MKGILALLIRSFAFAILLQVAVAQSEEATPLETDGAVTPNTEESSKCDGPGFLAVNPDNSTVMKDGEHVLLMCKFHLPMTCKWERKHIPVDITSSRRYFFCHGKSGENQMDCSLYIESYQAELDEGHWSCTGITSSGRELVRLTRSYHLLAATGDAASNQTDIVIPENPENTPTENGLTEDSPTEGSLIEDSPIEHSADNITTDEVHDHVTAENEPTDVLESGTTEPEPDETNASPTDVEVVKPPANATVSVGSTVTLYCGFNTEVDCIWKKNGEMHSELKQTKDCTLVFLHYEEKGITEWECSAYDRSEESDVPRKVSSKAWVETTELTPSEDPMTALVVTEVESSTALLSSLSIQELTPSEDLMSELITTEVESSTAVLSSSKSTQDGENNEETSVDTSTPKSLNTDLLVDTTTSPDLMTAQYYNNEMEMKSSSAVPHSSDKEDLLFNTRPDWMATPDTTNETEKESSSAVPYSTANDDLLVDTTTSPDSETTQIPISEMEMESSSAVLHSSVKEASEKSSEKPVEVASSTAVTIIVSSVVICLIGIVIAVSLCLYKRRKHVYSPKQFDSLVVHETRPSSADVKVQKEEIPLLVSAHPNGHQQVKLTDSDASNV